MITAASCRSSSFIKLSCIVPCFLTLSCTILSELIMAGGGELPAIPAERFMRASTGHALRDLFVACAVVVPFFRTPFAHLGLTTLEGFVTDLLAVVALLRSGSALKWPRISRFASCVDETLL